MIHPQITGSSVRFLLLALVFSALFLFTAQSVAAQGEEVIRVESNLVRLNVGVVDPKGRPVTNLSRNDFAVYEDGIKQSIQSFETTDRPFSVVLMLDVSGSTIAFRETFKQAAYRFLDALAPDDRVEVIAFNEKIKTIAPFTTNKRKVADAIFAADGKGQTEFYKALSFAISELDKEGNRRKAVVVMTDGLDSNLRRADRAATENAKSDAEAIGALRPEASPELLSVLAAADKRGVTVFPLALPSGDPAHIPLPDPQIMAIYTAARARLQLLADRTGGQLTAINRLDDLSRVYNKVAADLRTLYTIAYQPSGKESKPGWRAIRIEVAQPDLVARTKPGYVAR